MANEYIHNNPQDPVEERFVKLEEKFVDISCNMSLLMKTLSRKIKLFREVGGLN